jgi:hypothetical protein
MGIWPILISGVLFGMFGSFALFDAPNLSHARSRPRASRGAMEDERTSLVGVVN